MFWWVVLAVIIVIGLAAVLWFRGRSRSGSSSSFDQAGVTNARRDRGSAGGAGLGS